MSALDGFELNYDPMLFSTTAFYADGRMIELTHAASSLSAAKDGMRRAHPMAVEIDGEPVMKLSEYMRGRLRRV